MLGTRPVPAESAAVQMRTGSRCGPDSRPVSHLLLRPPFEEGTLAPPSLRRETKAEIAEAHVMRVQQNRLELGLQLLWGSACRPWAPPHNPGPRGAAQQCLLAGAPLKHPFLTCLLQAHLTQVKARNLLILFCPLPARSGPALAGHSPQTIQNGPMSCSGPWQCPRLGAAGMGGRVLAGL